MVVFETGKEANGLLASISSSNRAGSGCQLVPFGAGSGQSGDFLALF